MKRHALKRRYGHADGPITYSLHEIDKDGNVWSSLPHTSEGESRHVAQSVVAAWYAGRYRWAEDMNGKFLYGLDPKGKPMTHRPPVPEPKAPRARHGRRFA